MNVIDPDWRPVAFKEWQLVAEALAAGEQSVILRKGGISEGKLGFQWIHERFFLFPSRFHEQAGQVVPDADGNQRVMKPESDVEKIAFGVYVEAIKTGQLEAWGEVERLYPYHIWKEEIIRERFEWGEQQAISYAIVKAWKLEQPLILEDRKSFGGCRSWFGLPEESAWKDSLATAKEVENQCGYPDWLI